LSGAVTLVVMVVATGVGLEVMMNSAYVVLVVVDGWMII
jgi:hypothetical protein